MKKESYDLELRAIERDLKKYIDKLNKKYDDIFDFDEIKQEFHIYSETENEYNEIQITEPFLESIVDIIYDTQDKELKYNLFINDDETAILSIEIVNDIELQSLLNQYDFILTRKQDKINNKEMSILKDRFIPYEFLSEEEKKLLELTKDRVKKTKDEEELSYYELVLDVLLSQSFKNYKG